MKTNALIGVVLSLTLLSSIASRAKSAEYNLVWQEANTNAGFHSRDSAGEFVFNNKMWIMGGWYNSFTTNELRDVWSSADGANWTLVTAQAAWTHPQHPVSLVFDNKMWMMGGGQGGQLATADQTSEVWWSDNGASWTQATTAPWAARFAAGGAVFNNKMWIFGGTRNTPGAGSTPTATGFNDVWNSADGVNWTQATQHAPWSARGYEQVLVFNNKLWLLGGGNYKTPTATFELNNDVWSSDDGVNWTLATAHAAWSPRIWHEAIVYNNEMWILGGGDSGSRILDDAWHSSDGVNWTQATTWNMWSPRHEVSAYDFQGKLWVVAGGALSATGTTNEVWKTSIAGLASDYNGPGSGSTAVPEPDTLALVVLGVLMLGAACHRQARPNRGAYLSLPPLLFPVACSEK